MRFRTKRRKTDRGTTHLYTIKLDIKWHSRVSSLSRELIPHGIIRQNCKILRDGSISLICDLLAVHLTPLLYPAHFSRRVVTHFCAILHILCSRFHYVLFWTAKERVFSTDYPNLEFSASICRWGSLLGILQAILLSCMQSLTKVG